MAAEHAKLIRAADITRTNEYETFTIHHEGKTGQATLPVDLTVHDTQTYKGLTRDFDREYVTRYVAQGKPTVTSDGKIDPHLEPVSDPRQVPFAESRAGGGGGSGFEAPPGEINAMSGELRSAASEGDAAAQCAVPRPGDAATVFACVASAIGNLDDSSRHDIMRQMRAVHETAANVRSASTRYPDADQRAAAGYRLEG